MAFAIFCTVGTCAMVLFSPEPAESNPFGGTPCRGEDCPGINSYGLDSWIDLGLTSFGNFIPAAIQGISTFLWWGAMNVISGVLKLLQWAFSLKLTQDAMPELTEALSDLHNNLLGTPWTLAAIAVAGLWGIWNGLVRLRTIQTFTGLLATVLLMAAALWIINRPQDTVGEFSRLANDSALSVVGLGAEGTTENPDGSFDGAREQVFNVIARGPWCALQFDEASFCDRGVNEEGLPNSEPRDDDARNVADVWLAHTAGSDDRKDVFEKYDDATDDDEDADERLVDKRHVELQKKEGAYKRLGILALILLGVLGAVCLFLWLALKLVIAGVMVLFLTLAAPVMLLVPAFGESGRKAFATWAKRLGGAIIAKLIYALFLGVVLFVGNLITGLDSLGWGGQWMILLIFWWGVLLKRKDIVGFATGDQGGALGGLGMLKAYLGYRAVRDVGGSVVRGATYLPRKAAGGAAKAVRGGWRWRKHPHQHGRDQAAQRSLKDSLRGEAGDHYTRQRDGANDTLNRDDEFRRYQKRDKYGHWQDRNGNLRTAPPAGKAPTPAEVQHARGVVGRYGASGDVRVTDADIERYVRETDDPKLTERYERMQQGGGFKRGEIREFKGSRVPFREREKHKEWNRKVRRERRRYRRESRLERNRRKVYR